MNRKITDEHSYEVITQTDDATGDILMPIPQEVLDKLGWKEGDDLAIDKDADGRLIITKVAK
jgi:AbrB family looped-hinge helix DNA binding protein